MKYLTSLIVLVVLASILVCSSAVPPSSGRQRRQSCNDGRLCTCQNVLDDGDYGAARDIVQCLDSFGIQHEFSAGSRDQITTEICQRYNTDAIGSGRLRKCVFQKSGLIENINGIDQWNLPLMRNFFINLYTSRFPEPEAQWIRSIIVTTFLTCDANPTDFEVFPFEECWARARALILAIIEDAQKTRKNTNQNLSNDGMNFAKNTELSADLLRATSEDIENSANVDPAALV